MDRKWIEHWINDLISIETIMDNSFNDWMWCHERYEDVDLDYMVSLWNRRKFSKFHGGLDVGSMLRTGE